MRRAASALCSATRRSGSVTRAADSAGHAGDRSEAPRPAPEHRPELVLRARALVARARGADTALRSAAGPLPRATDSACPRKGACARSHKPKWSFATFVLAPRAPTGSALLRGAPAGVSREYSSRPFEYIQVDIYALVLRC